MSFPILLIVILPAIFAIIVIYAIQAEKKRKAAVEAAATELGLAFTPALTGTDQQLFETFELAHVGDQREASSVTIADSGELRMVLFDYRYTVGSGKNKTTRYYSVVMAVSNSLVLPQFSMTPESFFHRMASFFGFKDIDFDDDPAFSDQFLLKGENEAEIRSFFTPHRRAGLIPLGPISVEAHDHVFICYRTGKQIDAAHLRRMIEEGFKLQALLS